MFIQNISAETQESVETFIYWIWKIDVPAWEIFQCEYAQAERLCSVYKDKFRPITSLGWGGGEVNTASNLWAGEWLFSTKVWVDLRFKSLVAWTNVALSSDANSVTINCTASWEANTASNLWAWEWLFSTKVWLDLRFRSLIAWSNVSFLTTGNDITINSSWEANTMTNLWAWSWIFASKVGVQFQMKSLVAWSNVTLTPTANDITIWVTWLWEVNTASNVWWGAWIYQSKVWVDFRFKSIVAWTGISITPNANDITITSTWEANTASNLGAGTWVFASKVGVDLQMKSIVAWTNVTISSTATEITINSTGWSGEAWAQWSRRANLVFWSPITLPVWAQVPADCIVTQIIVNVTTPFNWTAIVEFWDVWDTNRLAETWEVDLSVVWKYFINVYNNYVAATQVNATYTAGWATQWAANILLQYNAA